MFDNLPDYSINCLNIGTQNRTIMLETFSIFIDFWYFSIINFYKYIDQNFFFKYIERNLHLLLIVSFIYFSTDLLGKYWKNSTGKKKSMTPPVIELPLASGGDTFEIIL